MRRPLTRGGYEALFIHDQDAPDAPEEVKRGMLPGEHRKNTGWPPGNWSLAV